MSPGEGEPLPIEATAPDRRPLEMIADQGSQVPLSLAVYVNMDLFVVCAVVREAPLIWLVRSSPR